MTDDIDKKNTRVLRQGLDEDARLRFVDTKRIHTTMNRAQDLLEAEAGDRQQSCADLMEHIEAIPENADGEPKERSIGDVKPSQLAIMARQSLEREVKGRKMGESEA